MSRDLSAAAAECRSTLLQLGIPVGAIREIAPDRRARRRWGVCRREPDGSFRIGISPRLLEEDAPLQSLYETLYHELLHTVPGCMKHTGDWKRCADLVNRRLGLSIRRVRTAEELGVAGDPRVRYRFRCVGCGSEQLRYRECPFTRHPEHYRCGRCGGSFRRVL